VLSACKKDPERVVYNTLIRVDYKRGGIYDTAQTGTYTVVYNNDTIGHGKGSFFKQKPIANSGDEITITVLNKRKEDTMALSVKSYNGENFIDTTVTGPNTSGTFT